MSKIKNFSDFGKLNEGRDAICGTCGEHGYDEDLDRPCSNCGDTDWTQDFEGADDDDQNESEEVENIDIEISRLDQSISILGGDKSEEQFREAFKDSIVIPKYPETGEVTYDGNKIGYVDGFSGLVFTDMNWVKTHLDKINVIIKETGFWYG